ncbi:uracil-DNA glycosylase [Castellaniella caeni]
MKPQVRAIQAAWLAEIGVDVHWLDTAPASGTSAGHGGQRHQVVRDIDGRHDAQDSGGGQDPGGVQDSPGALTPRDAALAAAGVAVSRVAPAKAPEPAPGPTVRAADLADLPAVTAAVQACRQCPRHEHRIRAVPGAGVTQQPFYLVVGEQPSIADEVAGQPFQGDAGRLLAAMLASVRLPHLDSVYSTYVVKCRALTAREPDAEEIAACVPYLRREIELLQPRWILALGRVAAQAVLGGEAGLDVLHGGPHAYAAGNGRSIPVWVTHQPASLLVRSSLKAEAWRDLVGLAQAVRAA